MAKINHRSVSQLQTSSGSPSPSKQTKKVMNKHVTRYINSKPIHGETKNPLDNQQFFLDHFSPAMMNGFVSV